MNDRVSPERPLGADQLYTLLGDDFESKVIISRVVVQLDMDTLAAFSGLVVKMFSAAVRDGAHVGRMEALQAIQALIDEVAEGRARREAGERP